MISIRKNQQYVVRDITVAFHPGRAGGHARYRKPPRLGPLRKQALHLLRRDVAFDRVALDHRRVAATEGIGYSVTGPVNLRVLHILGLHTEAIGPQMLDPRAAAASGRVLVNGDGVRGVC